MKNLISDLDSNRFGFLIAKQTNFDLPQKDVEKFLIDNNVKLLICRLDNIEFDRINSLEKLGYQIKDFQITYNFDLRNDIKVENYNDNIIFRSFKKEDISDIKKISKESFQKYGHYAANDKLDKNKCTEI